MCVSAFFAAVLRICERKAKKNQTGKKWVFSYLDLIVSHKMCYYILSTFEENTSVSYAIATNTLTHTYGDTGTHTVVKSSGNNKETIFLSL